MVRAGLAVTSDGVRWLVVECDHRAFLIRVARIVRVIISGVSIVRFAVLDRGHFGEDL